MSGNTRKSGVYEGTFGAVVRFRYEGFGDCPVTTVAAGDPVCQLRMTGEMSNKTCVQIE